MSRPGATATGRRVVVAGGTSEIALAIVRELQRSAPREVALLGRDAERLLRAAAELTAQGCPQVITLPLQATATDGHGALIEEAFDRLGGADICVLAVGTLGERGGLPGDVDAAVDVMRVNFVGAGSLLLQLASRLRAQGGGALVVLSSVAAERPRRANAVYGATKSGLDALAQGLGDALRGDGVGVLVVRPGFVHTRMTRGLPPAPLATSAEGVASAVLNGLESGAHTVWAPASLRWAMIALKMLPRPLFRQLRQ